MVSHYLHALACSFTVASVPDGQIIKVNGQNGYCEDLSCPYGAALIYREGAEVMLSPRWAVLPT